MGRLEADHGARPDGVPVLQVGAEMERVAAAAHHVLGAAARLPPSNHALGRVARGW